MSKNSLNRREFAARAVAGAAAVTVANPALAQKSDKAGEKSQADTLLELLKAQYPENLTDERLDTLREKLHRQLLRSQLLSSFPLTNADEPATMFAAYRAEG